MDSSAPVSYNIDTITGINTKTYNDSSKNYVDSNHYETNYVLPAEHNFESGFQELMKHVVPGSIHDSEENTSRCRSGTRADELASIKKWATRSGLLKKKKKILWISGPEASGKTALSGTIADECQESGTLAASFFFSTVPTPPTRRSKRTLVATLVHQLVLHHRLPPGIRSRVLSCIKHNPLIFTKNLKVQFEKLILAPLRSVVGESDPADWPKFIIIDGLDQCDTDNHKDPTPYGLLRERDQDQLDILHSLMNAVQDHAFPFRIILTSRPHRAISEAFTTKTAANIVTILHLERLANLDNDGVNGNPSASIYEPSVLSVSSSETAREFFEVKATACLERLRDAVLPEAIYNPDTWANQPLSKYQITAQNEILGWVSQNAVGAPGLNRMMLVTGPPGSGKTAILGSLAEYCQERGLLAATFFFPSLPDSSKICTKQNLIATLVYQLLQHDHLSHIHAAILSSIDETPDIFSEPLDTQLELLILTPLRRFQGLFDPETWPRIIIIDGMDHFDDSGPPETILNQTEIFFTLVKAARDPAFPFRPIIANDSTNMAGKYLPVGVDVVGVPVDTCTEATVAAAKSRSQVMRSQSRIVPMPDDKEDNDGDRDSSDSDNTSEMSLAYWDGDEIIAQKPVIRGRPVQGLGRGPAISASHGKESSAKAKFGTRLVSQGSSYARPPSRRTQAGTPSPRRLAGTSSATHTPGEGPHYVRATTTRPAWDRSTRTPLNAAGKKLRSISQASKVTTTTVNQAPSPLKPMGSPTPSEDSGVGLYLRMLANDPSLGSSQASKATTTTVNQTNSPLKVPIASPPPSEDSGVALYRQMLASDPSLSF